MKIVLDSAKSLWFSARMSKATRFNTTPANGRRIRRIQNLYLEKYRSKPSLSNVANLAIEFGCEKIADTLRLDGKTK